ncbi:hypothetical protein BWR17_19795 (plasmid) [Phaeobacter inhibens]|nr:hypothetical protein BWR17_19795 [Phaeobacter inhibens]
MVFISVTLLSFDGPCGQPAYDLALEEQDPHSAAKAAELIKPDIAPARSSVFSFILNLPVLLVLFNLSTQWSACDGILPWRQPPRCAPV